MSAGTLKAPGTAVAPPEPTGRAADPHRVKAARVARALVLPAIGVSFLLTQIPFVLTIYYSLHEWNLLRPGDKPFIGLDNYRTVLGSREFFSSLRATVFITGGSVLLSLLLGLALALLLNRKFKGQGLARTLLITPFLVMPAAAALIWKWSFFDASVGILNWVLSLVGIDRIAWNTDFPLFTILVVLTWQYTPFMMLILLAGLQSEDQEILEAAAIDGAGRVRTFRHMTLPHLRPYIELSVLLGSIFLLQVFDPVHIMTKGTGGTKTLPYLLYERAFVGLDIGIAAAYGVVTVVCTILVATVALRLLFKIFSEEGAA